MSIRLFLMCLIFPLLLRGGELEEISALSIPHEIDRAIEITNGGIAFEEKPILFHPASNEDIISIISLAKKYQRKIRAVGSMHSLNPCCVTPDYLIALDRMNKVIDVGKDTCTVEAGIVIRSLCKHLDQYGLTLAVVGAICEQTIAGAISTGTRGQVPAEGSLGSLVTSLEIIDGSGKVKTFTALDHPDELYASITSLGLLGVITKVTLKCTPLFLMAEIIRRMDMQEVLLQLDTLLKEEKLSLYWNVEGEDVKVITGHRVLCDLPANALSSFTMLGVYPHLHTMENFPDTLQRIGKSWEIIALLEWTKEKGERCIKRIQYEGMGILQGDYAIAQEDFADVVKEVKKFFRENRHRLNLAKDRMVVEIRPVKRDQVWLSPSYERDSISLCFHDFLRGIPWQRDEGFLELEKLMKKYRARPHLGKAHFYSKEDLEEAFPRWKDFENLRKEADPENIFITEYFSRMLGVVKDRT